MVKGLTGLAAGFMPGMIMSGTGAVQNNMYDPSGDTNWGGLGGSIGGLLAGGALGAYGGRKISDLAARRVYTAGYTPAQRTLLKEQLADKSIGSDLKGLITSKGRLAAQEGGVFAKTAASEAKGVAGLLGKARLGSGSFIEGIAANPRLAMGVGGLVGASMLAKMFGHSAGDSQNTQAAAQLQQLSAIDAQNQQNNLAALSNVPQIRF